MLVCARERTSVAIELYVANLAVHMALVEDVAVFHNVVAVVALVNDYYRCRVVSLRNIGLCETSGCTSHHHCCYHHSEYCCLHNFVPFFIVIGLNILVSFFWVQNYGFFVSLQKDLA